MGKLIIVVAQINLLVGDIKGNTKRIISETKLAHEKYHADLVMFPELSLTGYPPEDLLLRPGFYARCERAIADILQADLKPAILMGYPEKQGEQCFNKAALIQDGEIKATCTKRELPNYTVFDEKRYFTPGNKPCVYPFKGVNIGIMICEDLWYREITQQVANAHADLIVSLNASPYDHNKVRARQAMLTQRAKETHLPIIYGNLVGGQDELVYDGGSMVVDSTGQRIQQAAYYQEDHMIVEVETNDKPIILPKKLPPRLSCEENIYQALTLGAKDYIQKNHFPGAIIGLSGGIDSALTLAIAADAIGGKNIKTVMMPSRYTSDMSLEDAKEMANHLGVDYSMINIEPIFNTFLNSLASEFAGKKPDVTEENIQARIRGMLLMALSNKFGSIVLTTGNKSEMSVGYATLYGDMAGGFSVLKDIPKTLVYELANYRNSISPIIPKRIIERTPTAELAFDQKDEDKLPPYPILDEILERYIEQDQDPQSIYQAGFDSKVVNDVIRMVNNNEYKRRQAPVGIRITERAFGKDRRYPITSGYTENI